MQKTMATAWTIVAMGLLACKGSPGGQGQESTQQTSADEGMPLQFKLAGSPRDRFELDGLKGQGSFKASGSTLKVTFFDLPKGTKYEIGSERDSIQDESNTSVDVDISPQLVNANLRDLGASGKLDLGLTIKLLLPDRRRGELQLPPLSMSLGERFEQVRAGAISFGKEPEDSGPPNSLVLVDVAGWEIFGQPGKLFELDWIAVMDRLPQEGTKRCAEYKKNTNLAPFSEITLRLKKTEVSIYDRRSGSVVKKKAFSASTDCPKLVFRTGNADQEQDSTVPLADIKEWLRGEMSAKK
jgi:hypothetical protein